MSKNFFQNFTSNFKREILLIAPLRQLFFRLAEKRLYRNIVERRDSTWASYAFPLRAREDNFYITRALIRTIDRGLTNGSISKQAWRKSFDFVSRHLPKIAERKSLFFKKYGLKPPGAIAISLTRQCNLKCSGCYSNSSQVQRAKLPFEIISRIIKEQKKLWGSYFTILTGGEPLIYNEKGKTLFDLAAEHPDTFFLVYTNGVLIDEKTAEKLAKLGNITPAISVEGFEKETDERRGSGTFQKISRAFELLKKNGVLFGISITPNRQNAELIMSDEFIDYYFQKIGAVYASLTQYMPVGRDPDLNLMVTPEQRIMMFKKTWSLIKEKQIPFIDLENCGSVIGGCIAAGRPHGYLHIDWNGDVTPCVFYPYSSQNIMDVYKNGGNLDVVVLSPFFKKIQQWENDYVLDKSTEKMGNMIACCPIRDHFEIFSSLNKEVRAKATDEISGKCLESRIFKEKLTDYGQRFKTLSQKIWDNEYLAPEIKVGSEKNREADNQ